MVMVVVTVVVVVAAGIGFAQLELPRIAEYRESGTFVELPKARAAELRKVA